MFIIVLSIIYVKNNFEYLKANKEISGTSSLDSLSPRVDITALNSSADINLHINKITSENWDG